MKKTKIILFLWLLSVLTLPSSFAGSMKPPKTPPANLSILSKLTKEDLEKKLGRKLKFKEKLGLKFIKVASKLNAKKEIKKQNKILKGKKVKDGGDWGVGFILGLLLALLGVLIAYAISDDAASGAWGGFLIWILIVLLLLV